LGRAARKLGVITWSVEVPTEHELVTAMEEQPTSDSEHYLFPRHRAEIDRLDVQHYALREALKGNYVAPLEDPAWVLDVGSGTGQWAFDVAERFPKALVIGLDLVASKPNRPPRYRWVRGNLLQGLPFGQDRFDFVHQRLLLAGVPLASWRPVVEELARVARPGGWVELVEPMMFNVDRPGPVTERLVGLAQELAGSRGLDPGRVVFDSLDDYLRQAGLTNVIRQEVSLPMGEWGGPVGTLMATDARAAFTRVSEVVLRTKSTISAKECHDLVHQATQEWEQYRTSWTVAIAVGRKFKPSHLR
jgi:SAM-dependent methyltransferase